MQLNIHINVNIKLASVQLSVRIGSKKKKIQLIKEIYATSTPVSVTAIVVLVAKCLDKKQKKSNNKVVWIQQHTIHFAGRPFLVFFLTFFALGFCLSMLSSRFCPSDTNSLSNK